MTSTVEKIRTIIADTLGVDETALTPATNFKNDLQVDSLDMVELLVNIEKAFNIAIPDEQAERIETVQQISDYVVRTGRLVAA